MRLEDSPWKRFVARALVLSVMLFGAVRLAVADPGVAGGAARSYVTVAGTLTGVPGTATARFRFYDARTGGTLLCESSAMIPGGAFSAEVPLEGMGVTGPRCATMFDGADVFVEVAVNGTILGERGAINPVPYAHYASVAGAYGFPDCPVGYERATDAAFTGDRLCVRRRADRTIYDEVVRVGSGASAFWIDRHEATVTTMRDGSGDALNVTSEIDLATRGLPRNGEWRGRTPPLFAVSVARATPPSRWVTWFQAQELCHASGKRLPTRDEWLGAARGTAETGCHIATTNAGPRNTADGASCVSEWGARDMVGNLWEWTDEWYAGLSGSGTDGRSDWPTDYGGDGTWNITPSVFNMPGSTRNFAIPAVAERGGAWPREPTGKARTG